MKTRHVHLQALLLSAFASATAGAVRDPFWPIDYAPAPPPAPAAESEPAEPAPAAPPKPAEKPVTDADWAKARKALPVSGFTKSVRPDTKEVRVLAMINRRSYRAGETLTFVTDDIRFQWRIDAITEKGLSLTPLAAARVAPQPSDLKENP